MPETLVSESGTSPQEGSQLPIEDSRVSINDQDGIESPSATVNGERKDAQTAASTDSEDEDDSSTSDDSSSSESDTGYRARGQQSKTASHATRPQNKDRPLQTKTKAGSQAVVANTAQMKTKESTQGALRSNNQTPRPSF